MYRMIKSFSLSCTTFYANLVLILAHHEHILWSWTEINLIELKRNQYTDLQGLPLQGLKAQVLIFKISSLFFKAQFKSYNSTWFDFCFLKILILEIHQRQGVRSSGVQPFNKLPKVIIWYKKAWERCSQQKEPLSPWNTKLPSLTRAVMLGQIIIKVPPYISYVFTFTWVFPMTWKYDPLFHMLSFFSCAFIFFRY